MNNVFSERLRVGAWEAISQYKYGDIICATNVKVLKPHFKLKDEELHHAIMLGAWDAISQMGIARNSFVIECMKLKQRILSANIDYVPLGLKFKKLKFFKLTSYIIAQVIFLSSRLQPTCSCSRLYVCVCTLYGRHAAFC